MDTNAQQFVVPDWKVPSHVKAYTTTRCGGVSSGAYQSFNLAYGVGDAPAHVAANRQLLETALRLPGTPIWMEQVHANRVIDISRTPDRRADAAVCSVANAVCAILTADCLPVLFCHCLGDRVGIAHAGWRGLARGVIAATVCALRCDPTQLLAWIGPGISAHHYSVDDRVRDTFLQENQDAALAFLPDHNGAWTADLCQIAYAELRRCGVTQVSGGSCCTYVDARRFYSFRRARVTGRMASLIWLSSRAH